MNKHNKSPRCLYIVLFCCLLYAGWFVTFALMDDEIETDDGFSDKARTRDYPLKALISALTPRNQLPPVRCGLVFPNASQPQTQGTPTERIPIIYPRYNASGRKNANILNYAWLDKLDPEKYQVVKYEMKDTPCRDEGDKFCVYPNRGHEVASYLKYIIDHYSLLPHYAIFIHGHQTSWHAFDKTRLLQMLSMEVLRQNAVEYFNFRSMKPNSIDTCAPMEWKDAMRPCMAEGWERVYKGHDDFPPTPPSLWTIYCCAEFIVSRDAILRRPRQFYENALFWLWNTTYRQDFTSRFFEFTWHMIFTARMSVPECKSNSKPPPQGNGAGPSALPKPHPQSHPQSQPPPQPPPSQAEGPPLPPDMLRPRVPAPPNWARLPPAPSARLRQTPPA